MNRPGRRGSTLRLAPLALVALLACPTVLRAAPPAVRRFITTRPETPPAPTSAPKPDRRASPSPATLGPAALAAGVSADSDLLLLPAARRPPPRPLVIAATRVAAPAQDVATVFLSPASLRQALPALVRADVVSTRPGPRSDAWPDRLLDWEVEVPLFNLTGKAWLQQRPDGAELTLVEGAFAPGTLRFRVAAEPAAVNVTILTCEIQVEARSSNWIFRKVAGHDPWAETAMSAAMVWVVARAIALRAEAPQGQPPARPRSAIQAPAAQALDGTALAQPALAGLRAAGTLALVRRAPSGRLAWSSVAFPARGSTTAVWSRLSVPENWIVFPGWKSVKRRPPAAGSHQPLSATIITVKDDISLVDLDADWAVDLAPPLRATAVGGDTRGAVFAWQVWPGAALDSSLVVLSMHPRLDAAGFIERKLVAAEPLLEHALGLALAYVDAAAMADDLQTAKPAQ